MRLSEDKLVAWLCIIRLNFRERRQMVVPVHVQQQLCERGWMVVSEEPDWEGNHESHVTEEGTTASDLVAPEWGIDPVGVA